MLAINVEQGARVVGGKLISGFSSTHKPAVQRRDFAVYCGDGVYACRGGVLSERRAAFTRAAALCVLHQVRASGMNAWVVPA